MNSGLKMRTIACIQARMDSNRLPQKSLKILAGKPLIHWVIEGAKASKLVDQVILCTSIQKENDPLAEFVHTLGIEVFRGSETNVLNRFVSAGKEYKADWIVRICGDNPFLNGQEIDRLIQFFSSSNYDYAFNHIPRFDNNYPDGLGAEITRQKLLEEIEQTTNDPFDCEHVTQYIWKHQSNFAIGCLKAPQQIAFPHIKLDIDTVEDFDKMADLMAALIAAGQDPQSSVDVCAMYMKLYC